MKIVSIQIFGQNKIPQVQVETDEEERKAVAKLISYYDQYSPYSVVVDEIHPEYKNLDELLKEKFD